MSESENLTAIIGNKLEEIYLEGYVIANEKYESERITMKFEDLFFVLSVDANTDEIITEFKKEIEFLPETKLIQISKTSCKFLKRLIGHKPIWIWRLINNQGYFDGLQFQFGVDVNCSIQFISLASRLQINTLKNCDFEVE